MAGPRGHGCKTPLSHTRHGAGHLHRHGLLRFVLGRCRLPSPPPTASHRSLSLLSLHLLAWLSPRRHPHCPLYPHRLSLTLRLPLTRRQTLRLSRASRRPPSLSPRPSRAAVPRSHSRSATMTVRQLYTCVLPLHRRPPLRSSWQLSRVRHRAGRPRQPVPFPSQHHAHRRLHPRLCCRRLASSSLLPRWQPSQRQHLHPPV